jgi:hypothetical protein
VLVVRWVDRLGRNYDEVCDTIREFMRRGVVIRTVINNFTFDGATNDPVQKAVRDALIGFMAAEATKASQRAGIEHAKGRTDSPTLAGNRPSRGSSSPLFATCSARACPTSPEASRVMLDQTTYDKKRPFRKNGSTVASRL